MTDKQIINSCEFQSRCIQYKDMYSNKHIKCPIVDFAIACRGENKCKYKTVYEQLQAKEQECEELKKQINKQKNAKIQLSKLSDKQLQEFCNMKQALNEIADIIANNSVINKEDILNMIDEVKRQ